MSKLSRYRACVNQRVRSSIDFKALQKSYETDMAYAKVVLRLLHNDMIKVYGSRSIDEGNSDADGFVMVPGVVRSRKSGQMCIAILTFDVTASGEHWGTDYICRYGVIPQLVDDEKLRGDRAFMAKVKEMNAAFVPYDYGYTADLLEDIHIDEADLPDSLKAILAEFKGDKANELDETSLYTSALAVIAKAKENQKQQRDQRRMEKQEERDTPQDQKPPDARRKKHKGEPEV